MRRKFAPKDAGIGGAAVGALNGTIIALDLLDFEPIEGVTFIQGDFRDEAVLALLRIGPPAIDATSALIEAERDPDAKVREHARKALERIQAKS